jgi:hypothetical protein
MDTFKSSKQQKDTEDCTANNKHIPEIAWQYDALSLSKALNFTEEEIANMLECDVTWLKHNYYAPELQDRLSRLSNLIWKVYYIAGESIDNLHKWVESANTELGNHSPKSYLLQGNIKKVEDFVAQMESN